MLNASVKVVFSLARRNRFWLGMMISVSTTFCRASMPASACFIRLPPSNWNGLVTTPTVRTPSSRAACAMIGAAPVPVPPPMPAVMKHMCAPARWSTISSMVSSAAAAPTDGRAPAPRPSVTFTPIWILCGAFDCASACASVLATTNSTPSSIFSIMLFTAFPPAPPTPKTVIRGFRSACWGIIRFNVIDLSACSCAPGRGASFSSPGGLLPIWLHISETPPEGHEKNINLPQNLGCSEPLPAASCRRVNMLWLPVVFEPFYRSPERSAAQPVDGNLEIPPLVLRVCREQAQPHGARKRRARRRLRKPLDTERASDSHLLSEDLGREAVEPRNLASAPREHDLLRRQVFEARRVEPRPDLFEDLLDPRPHDPDEFRPADRAPVELPVAGVAAEFDHLAVVHPGRHEPAVERLDPLGRRHRDLQPLRDVERDVVPAETYGVGVDHVLLHEDRKAGRPAAHVDAGRAELLFVLDEARHARHVGRRGQPREFEVAALDAVEDVLDRLGVDRQHVHVAGEPLAVLPARVGEPAPVVEREIHRLGVQHVAPVAVVRHVAGGEHVRHVGLAHLPALDVRLPGQTV